MSLSPEQIKAFDNLFIVECCLNGLMFVAWISTTVVLLKTNLTVLKIFAVMTSLQELCDLLFYTLLYFWFHHENHDRYLA